jgi:hypothetical protein
VYIEVIDRLEAVSTCAVKSTLTTAERGSTQNSRTLSIPSLIRYARHYGTFTARRLLTKMVWSMFIRFLGEFCHR